MIPSYQYELWDGKRVRGYITTVNRIEGEFFAVSAIPPFKQEYSRKIEQLLFPMGRRVVRDDGVEWTTRRFIDVRRKSQRQIDILLKRGSSL